MRLKRCRACGRYTMREICPSCGSKTGSPHPPKFSPEDRYGKYRRLMRLEAQKNDGFKS